MNKVILHETHVTRTATPTHECSRKRAQHHNGGRGSRETNSKRETQVLTTAARHPLTYSPESVSTTGMKVKQAIGSATTVKAMLKDGSNEIEDIGNDGGERDTHTHTHPHPQR